ncbi:MAG: PKD domain-containing protein, partial [Planctomycetes bacterium]|nr:PKD domain-containing protein [Planctomycetota bacterium]
VHVAATFDGSTLRLYFNGALDGSLSVAPELLDTSMTDFLIGAGVTVDGAVRENFAGLIDELGVYNRALRQEEIDSIYRAGSAGKCLNRPPLADASGPYTIQEGDALSLSAAASTDPDGDALTYSWDVNGDGTFGDATGVNPHLSWAELQALGIDDGPGIFTVRARVDDGHVAVDSPAVTLTVNNTPPTATLSSDGPIDEGSAVVVSFGETSDPSSADRAAGFRYSFARSADALATSYAAAGIAMSTSFTFDDNGVYTVYGRVFDKDGGYTNSQTTVLVNNVPPTAIISGPADGVRGQPRTFTLTASDPSTADQRAGFTFRIDWGDGSHDVVHGPSGLTVEHIFSASGSYNVQVTATDKDGGTSSVVSRTITIQPIELQGDTLVIGGTPQDDVIVVNPGKKRDGVKVSLNGVEYTFTGVGRIVAFGQAGDDVLVVAGGLRLPTELYGGTGNDYLKGDNGPNILVGGDGDDVLIGGTDRDLLIGGTGADRLLGRGDDILIAGEFMPGSGFAESQAALGYVMDQWNAPTSYTDRTHALLDHVFARVSDDDSVDVLKGQKDQDWYFADLTGPVKDKIKDLTSSELAVELARLERDD